MKLCLLAQAAGDGVGAAGGALALGGGMMLVMLILGLLCLVLWIWALIDAIQNPGLNQTERLIWVLVILLTNTLGAILYLLIGRSRRAMTT
ncbi:MAG TPA: PLD nuclease N-terminal domain-containing protein [Pirellulaceae bacterium]|nr:PLD nuclease N-terminal domain-containing protein [Pirellulaceae bacterium]